MSYEILGIENWELRSENKRTERGMGFEFPLDNALIGQKKNIFLQQILEKRTKIPILHMEKRTDTKL